ncbi:MAG TPA: hypothetical protein VNW26_01425 [Steroidobacteraceae bacterium]|jgi:hypothetical protein|nr:hypothetical protein [Steroidobacteraceae bacterium]
MFRFALLMFLSTGVYAAQSVDIETAAKIYQEAAMREQVRATLGTMPAHIRQLFSADTAAKLSEQQLNAVTAAAKRGFRIDVFEVPALSALAANLDAATEKKIEAFLESDLGRRMVAADVATASLEEAQIDKIMRGELSAPTTAQRDALFDKLEQASRSTESTVRIFLSMGQAVAIGTAVGSGRDTASVAETARKAGEATRPGLEQDMREPLRRYLAYSYRDMSDADLKHLLAFLESVPGKRYVSAYVASLGAGFDAMGKRCGEQLGESLRELAQAQVAVTAAGPPPPPPAIAAPAPTRP